VTSRFRRPEARKRAPTGACRPTCRSHADSEVPASPFALTRWTMYGGRRPLSGEVRGAMRTRGTWIGIAAVAALLGFAFRQ
jgi:hypothetical protein